MTFAAWMKISDVVLALTSDILFNGRFRWDMRLERSQRKARRSRGKELQGLPQLQ
jgi:hypothetical protein